VIAREGIAAATTRRIAEEAGVPPGLVHYWFAGKDELLAAVVAEALDSIEAAAGTLSVAIAGLPVSLFDRLRAAFRAVEQDDSGRQIGLYEMTTWALRRPDLREVARHQYVQYRRLAADATAAWLQETGGRFPGGVEALAQFVAALFDGLTLAWLADPEGTDVDAVLRLVSELVEGQVLAAS
jgi:AcrR family transcriptional regulator